MQKCDRTEKTRKIKKKLKRLKNLRLSQKDYLKNLKPLLKEVMLLI